MRRLLAPAILAATLPSVTLAQDTGRPSLWDFFSLDIVVQRIFQSGIMALRTQLDLKYTDLAIDLRTGSITMTDIQAWPLPPWDANGDCEVRIDRLVLRSGALDQPERVRMKAQATGLGFAAICLPPDAREGLALAGLSDVSVPRMTLDVDYGVPGSDAAVRVHADVDGLATADLTADFTYFWFDGREDMEDPDPVMFLETATLSLENRGGWERLKPVLPPPFTGDGAALVVEGALGQGLIEMNVDTAGEEANSLSDAQRAFVASAAEVWAAFLADPERLVLETGMEGDVFLDFDRYEDDPRAVFDDLRPRLALAPRRQAEVLPLDLLTRALGDAADGLSDADRKRVGLALVTGVGAPRNVEAGFGLLNPIARAGDGEAAAAMAEALRGRQPGDAYRWALVAGAAGEAGATALLDRMERDIAFADILQAQADVAGAVSLDPDKLGDLSAMRNTAAAHLSGRGAPRSYESAAAWAMLAAAAGDPEARDILGEIGERARLSGADAQRAWAAAEARASAAATEAWIGQDLPARLAD